ncbi:MAG: SGNH/GDSL hydrolase family protein [Eubacterium sp.]|nr:SGNH/GDSL hydrolase family protein [Eubacterium sp.]
MLKNKKISLALVFCIILSLLSTDSLSFVNAEGYSDSDRIIVSLGDSYSSGEGLGDYYDDGESISGTGHNVEWLSHRSKNAWSGKLTLKDGSTAIQMSDSHYDSGNKNANWFFTASSGAEIKDILGKQSINYDLKGNLKSKTIEPQINVFGKLGKRKADYVTLTIGGNDLHFADIVEDVYYSYLKFDKFRRDMDNAYKQLKPGTQNNKTVRDKLKEVYTNISDSAGPQAKVLVAGYPQLFSGSTLYLSNKLFVAEAVEVDLAVNKFNKLISSLTEECRKENKEVYYVSVESGFLGHGAYSISPYVSGIWLKCFNVIRDLDDKDDSFISSKSMHPNEKGAEVYRKCIQDKIDGLEKNTPESWKSLYSSEIERYRKKCDSIKGVIRDLDGDGVPELFLTPIYLDQGDITVIRKEGYYSYKYENGELKALSTKFDFSNLEYTFISSSSSLMGRGFIDVGENWDDLFQMRDGDLYYVESYFITNQSEDTENGFQITDSSNRVISEEEFKDIMSRYGFSASIEYDGLSYWVDYHSIDGDGKFEIIDGYDELLRAINNY